MKMKKILSLALVVLTVFSVMSISAITSTAAGSKTPTQLYIGQNTVDAYYGTNLIDKITNTNPVVSNGAYDSSSYFSLYIDNGKFILELHSFRTDSFYYDNATGEKFGIYCNGDITIVLYGSCSVVNTFDSYCDGIYSAGTLTLQAGDEYASLNVSSTRRGIASDAGIVIENGDIDITARYQSGISAPGIAITGGTVTSTGNIISVECTNFIITDGTLDAKITSVSGYNTYAIKADKYLIISGSGMVYSNNVQTSGRGVGVYLHGYKSLIYRDITSVVDSERSYSSVDESAIYFISSNSKCVKLRNVQGDISAVRSGNATVYLTLNIGNRYITIDKCDVGVKMLWWQWILKIITLGLY